MRKLLGLALLLVALPACATARSIGETPGDALGDLGCAVSGAIACSPEGTVKPLVSEPAPDAPIADPTASETPSESADETPAETPAEPEPEPAAELGPTHPIPDTLWRPVSVQSRGVGYHWWLEPDLFFGPALEWSTERDVVVEERLTLGLTLRF